MCTYLSLEGFVLGLSKVLGNDVVGEIRNVVDGEAGSSVVPCDDVRQVFLVRILEHLVYLAGEADALGGGNGGIPIDVEERSCASAWCGRDGWGRR